MSALLDKLAQLPKLDGEKGAWAIYQLPDIALPYSAPMRGFHLSACELEIWDGENLSAEVLVKKDSSIDLRTYLTTDTETAIIAHLAKVGITARTSGWRESGAQGADCIILNVELHDD